MRMIQRGTERNRDRRALALICEDLRSGNSGIWIVHSAACQSVNWHPTGKEKREKKRQNERTTTQRNRDLKGRSDKEKRMNGENLCRNG